VAVRSLRSTKSDLALLAACCAVALRCQARTSSDTADLNGTAPSVASTRPFQTAERYRGLPQASAADPALAAVAPPSAPPSVAPIPSLIEGRAACSACLEAERAGRYLSPQGVGHYLVGCDDDALRAHCLAASKRSLPGHVQKLASAGDCAGARKLAEFGDRSGASSPALHAAVASCRNP
jgi:hypothetical protein